MSQRGGYRRVSVNSMLKIRDSDWGSKKKTVNFLLIVSPFHPIIAGLGGTQQLSTSWFPSIPNTCVYTNEKATHSMAIVFYTCTSSRRRFCIYLTTARQTVRGCPPGALIYVFRHRQPHSTTLQQPQAHDTKPFAPFIVCYLYNINRFGTPLLVL